MTIYGRMDDSVDPNDANYVGIPSLSSSPSMERLTSSVGPSHHNFDDNFPYSSSSFDTIEPSSLELFHTSHDDTCLDKCLGTYPPQAIHRNTYAPLFSSRSRFPVPSFSYPYHLPDSNAFQFPGQPFNPLYSDAFSNMGLKYNLNHDIRPGHHTSNSESLIGNHFNASDLGVQSQRPVPDDCASVNCSKYSCSSECCSTQVCQEEECSGDGTPCDDLHCFDGVSQPLDDMWALNQSWHNSLQPEMTSTLHQSCNHTNTEHDVAITLRDLSAPDASNAQQQHEHEFSQFERRLVGADQPTDISRSLSLPVHTHLRLSSTPDIDSVPPPLEESMIQAGNATEHICQWVISPGGSDTQGNICGHVCNDPYSLHEHLCNEHIAPLSNKMKYLCLWKGCTRRGDQVFASRNKLRRHLATHTAYKPHKCEICGEGFSAQQALDQHVRTHTGETPYKCDYEGCGKAFKQKSALTMHKRTHTGEKPLECDICGKRFCESSNLSKHRKTHNPDFKFKCDEPGCGSQFIRIDQLRRHQARHDRPKRKQKARTAAGPSPISPISPGTPQDSILLDNEQQT
ncbi:hypothetical protein F4781DRAFT_423125 [Annulohypoxylon bovei var. microspora]|nr:hypothetical protein F4781DRAFT_423125 [Annulohypoxylon bovei var. microspora]